MRSFAVALAFTLLAGPPPDDDLVISDGTVIVGAGSTLTYHRPDGTTATRRIPGSPRLVEEVNASASAATLITLGDDTRGLYGPPNGPFKRFKGRFIDVAVSGPEALALYPRRLGIVNVRTGRTRSLRIREPQPYVLTAAGRYFAYRTDEQIVVRSLRTGREVYRVRSTGDAFYRLGPGGQLVVIASGELERFWRIRIATPHRPRWRTIREAGLGSFSFAVTRDAIAIARGDARARTEVALLDFNGRVTPVTPLLPRVGAIAFDGNTLAFAVGNCVFRGPAERSPVATDGCVPSADGGAGR